MVAASSRKGDQMPVLAPAVSDERDALLKYIKVQRDALKASVFGLNREEATSAPSASALSLGGLLKHVALTERHWVAGRLAGRDIAYDYQEGFMLRDDESVDDVVALLDEVGRETEEVVKALPDLDYKVPVPKGVPWYPADLEFWTARWILFHVIEELARHAGHADIIRETIDGSNAFVLLAKSEGDNPPWLAMLERK
jgi:uncharacterized damage-inducible protein DinB